MSCGCVAGFGRAASRVVDEVFRAEWSGIEIGFGMVRSFFYFSFSFFWLRAVRLGIGGKQRVKVGG